MAGISDQVIKKEKINLYGKVYDARHFVILSKSFNKKDSEERRYDVWLDINTNHILKMTYSKYGLWEYKLKQVIYSKWLFSLSCFSL